jgi:hypothetical protein
MAYPVVFEADYVHRRSRLSTFFRGILVIPQVLWAYLYGIVAYLAIICAWFAIVITGHYPAGLYRFVSHFVRWATRFTAYYFLLTDHYPSFGGEEDETYPIRVHFDGPLPRYSRLKTFFRGLLQIPIAVVRYVLGLLISVGALAAWFVIVITGRLPRGLFDMMVLGQSYTARSDAYLTLLTETYPPFQDEQTRAAGMPEAV